MSRKILFVLFAVLFIVFLPCFVFAQSSSEELVKKEDKIELKQKEEDSILLSLKQSLAGEWMDSIDFISGSGAEHAILAILRKEMQVKALNSILKDVGVTGIKVVLETALVLISEDPAILIKEIEKFTVDKATEYATDWFLQKEMKIGSGNLKFTFQTYDKSWQVGKFPYIIVYNPISTSAGEVLVSIYSSETIKAPYLDSRIEWEGGIEKIPPFILQIKGEIKKNDWDSYSWVKGPEFKFIFDQPVPKLEFKEPTIIDQVKSQADRVTKILGTAFNKSLGKTREVVTAVKSSWDKLGSFMSDFKLFGGTLVNAPALSSDWQEVSDNIEEEPPAFAEDLEKTEEAPVVSVPQIIIKTVPADNQAEIENLKREMEDFKQKLNDLMEIANNMEEEELKNAKVEVAEVVKTVKKNTSRGGSSLAPAPSYCNLDNASFPLKSVVFGSIGWLGNEDSANNEWIELRNVTGSIVSLDGWQVLDKDLQIKVVFPSNKVIEPYGVFLMERTDDSSVPNRIADYIYSGALNNDDEIIYLFNNNCALQDRATNVIQVFPSANQNNSEVESVLDVVSESNEKIVVSPKVLINEIAWMGTKASSSDEWIELYNPGEEPVNLTGWSLSGGINVSFSLLSSVTPTIEPLGYFLMERTDDTTISDIKADKIYTGALNDNGEMLELKDNNGNLIDKADFSSGWTMGNKDKKVSIERFDENSWKTNNLLAINGRDADGGWIFGTPKAENSVIRTGIEISYLHFEDFDEITLPLAYSPYTIKGNLIVPQGKKLFIEPGVVLKFFDQYTGLTIEGELRAVGTEEKKIIFTSAKDSPVAGDWGQIYFRETSVSSEISNAIVEYGGGDPAGSPCSDNMAGIRIEKVDVSLNNLIIRNNLRRGVFLVDSNSVIDGAEFLDNPFCDTDRDDYGGNGIEIRGGSPEIKNSSFKGHVIGIWMAGSASIISDNNFEENQTPVFSYESSASFSGNTAQNNGLNGILITGDILRSTEWKKDLIYIVDSVPTIVAGASLVIDAGVIVKFYDSYSGLRVDGDLKVLGEEGKEVLFTSDNNTPGAWDKIEITSMSQNSEINNAVIEYAGGGYGTPCSPNMAGLKITGANVKLNKVFIKNTQYRGVYLIASPTILDEVSIENTTKCLDIYGGDNITIE
jgi:hypothetical protein